VVSISRRIGHHSPNVMFGTYGHLFRNTDVAAAKARSPLFGGNWVAIRWQFRLCSPGANVAQID
jgi:hypothetical protein